MAEKESSSKQWSDPKDFGLPFVEITPLPTGKTKAKVKETQTEVAVSVVESPKVEVAPKQETTRESKQTRPLSPPKAPSATKSGSKAWVWVVVFVLIGAVSVIVWQLQSGAFLGSGSINQVDKVSSESISQIQKKPLDQVASLSSDSLARADSLVGTGVDSDLATAANSGTTIASTSSINFLPITSKGEKKRFFLVIASLPNEPLIKDFAAKMTLRPAELYLITPYTDSPNYRLAIAKFDSWNAASAELAKVKAQYGSDLWILNY